MHLTRTRWRTVSARRRVVLAGLVAAAVLAGWPAGRASACGFWTLHDDERGADVGWLVDSADVRRQGHRVGAFYLDVDAPGGARVAEGKEVVFDVARGWLRRRGKPVGRLVDQGALAIGPARYALAFSDPHTYQGSATLTAWRLEVRRGDEVVLHADEATALCAAAPDAPAAATTPEGQQAEIRRRVAFYLLWRDLGAGR
jgi:hypothetical protein